jgi:hypothetical protein
MAWEFLNNTTLTLAVFFGILIIFYLIVREIRLMRTGTRKMELEVEREKLEIIKADLHPADHPFARLSAEQLAPLQAVESENAVLATDIFAKERLVEGRLLRVENKVRRNKLERMLDKIAHEEKRLD